MLVARALRSSVGRGVLLVGCDGVDSRVLEELVRRAARVVVVERDVAAVAAGRVPADSEDPEADLEAAKAKIGFESLQLDEKIGKLSIVGSGMKTHSGVSATLFGALAKAGVNIEMISTSEIRISVVTDIAQVDEAARVVHTAFGLDGDGEAVIYAGTGR
jgi:aspartate kinase